MGERVLVDPSNIRVAVGASDDGSPKVMLVFRAESGRLHTVQMREFAREGSVGSTYEHEYAHPNADRFTTA